MEIIKKKICLEHFRSRIPGMISTVDGADINNCVNGSWGKIPKTIALWGKQVKYHTLMDLYYTVLKIVINAEYYEYDGSGKKWLKSNFDWRDSFNHNPTIAYYGELPTDSLRDKTIVGITSDENVTIFYDKVTELTDSAHNGLELIMNVNAIIGRVIIPYSYKCNECGYIKFGADIKTCPNCGKTNLTSHQDMFVPYFIYWKDIDTWIKFLISIKTDNCCERKKYQDYGGDAFLEYLTDLQEKGWEVFDRGEIPTIDIPILLTSKITDIGQYRTYNVDIITEDGQVLANDIVEPNETMVITQSESKLKTLRKNKRSVDDNGVELPFILSKNDDGTYSTSLPYQTNYIKNIQLINGVYYGDTIVSMKETCTAQEITESRYNILTDNGNIPEDLYSYGTVDKPISGVSSSEVKPKLIRYGSKDKNTITDVDMFFESDSQSREMTLLNNLMSLFTKTYPNKLCFKQDFIFEYELIYGVEDYENTYPDEEGNIITPIKEAKMTKEHSGTLYISFTEPQITITYVLGGRFKENGKKLTLNEISAFDIGELMYSSWDGEGIWYRETFPMKKHCVGTFIIDGVTKTFPYDIIDFASKEITHTFNGIDFPRKNYILCEEVRYKSDSYYQNSTQDIIFRDEKMLGLNYQLKETYDVAIDRGSSAAFEKHMQLSELKTWQDLENYRNGMFLNK